MIAGLLFVTSIVVWQTRPARVIAKRQAELISGIERRNPARIRRLVAESYGDKWGFSGEDAVVALVDVGSQFMILVLKSEKQMIEIGNAAATVSVHLTVSGKPLGPVANEVTRRANRLKEPFVFTWEKQSFLPSSWRLVRIDQPEMPEELYGYEPGDIRRAMQGE